MAWKETSTNAPKGPPPEVPRSAPLAGKIAAADAAKRGAGGSVEAPPRLTSLDAYRGAIMLLMASAGLHLAEIVRNDGIGRAGIEAGSLLDKFIRFSAWQMDHVPWQGGVLWDMIQPAFMFMVGVALPYSYAARAAKGDSYLRRFGHMLYRSLMLIFIAFFLSTAVGDRQTNFFFMNVLAQIGLGYPLLFLFVNRPLWLQTTALALILGGAWYAYFQHPLPPEGFDYAAEFNLKFDDPNHLDPNEVMPHLRDDLVPAGRWQHWAIHTNFGTWLDQAVLNQFPRQEPFVIKRGGYATFNFVASLGTMLLGLIVGELLRSPRTDGEKLKRLGIIAAICLVLGLALGYTAVPIIKRIWTPSWMLVSGAAVVGMLAAFYWVIDVRGWKRLAWPLAVVGMNSIAVYMMAQLLRVWTGRALKTHLGLPYRKLVEWLNATAGTSWNPEVFGGPFGSMFQSLTVLFVFWLVCVWMWRRKIFIRL